MGVGGGDTRGGNNGGGGDRASVFPLWLLLALSMLRTTGAVLSVHCFVTEGFSSLPHAKLYVMGVVTIIATCTLIGMVQCMVISRVKFLSLLLQEDVQEVVGDPASFVRLTRLPGLGVREIDQLQISIKLLYFGLLDELCHHGVITHGDGATADVPDPDKWYATDEEDPYVDRLSEKNSLDEYFVSRGYHYKQKLSSMLQISSEAESRATGFVRGLFSSLPLSARGLMATSLPPTLTNAEFFSVRSSPMETAALLESAYVTRQTSPQSSFSHTTGVEEGGQPSCEVQECMMGGQCDPKKESRHRHLVPLSAQDRLECDPLDDNTNNSFELLAQSLKIEGGIIFQVLRSIKVGHSLSSITLPVHILKKPLFAGDVVRPVCLLGPAPSNCTGARSAKSC